MNIPRSYSPPGMFCSPGTITPTAEMPQRPLFKRPFTTPTEFQPTQDLRASFGDTRGAIFLPFAIGQAGKMITEECILWPTAKRGAYPRSKSDDCQTSTHKRKKRTQRRLKSSFVAPESLDVPDLQPPKTPSYTQQSQQRSPSNKLDVGAESSGQDDVNRDYLVAAPSIAFGDVLHRDMIQHLPKLTFLPTTDGASDAQDDVEPCDLSQSRRSTLSLGQPTATQDSRSQPVRRVSDSSLHRVGDGDHALRQGYDDHRSRFKNPFSNTRVLPAHKTLSELASGTEMFSDPFAGEGSLQRPSSFSFKIGTDHDSYSDSDDSPSIIYHDTFQGHRDTLALISYQKRRAPQIPQRVFSTLLEFLSFEDYKSLRLTSKGWLSSLPTPALPATFNIPSEILQAIYRYLSPRSFDAARHTCRSWFLAGLDKTLQLSMLHQAGCEQARDEDIRKRQAHLEARTKNFEHRRSLEHTGRRVNDCHQENIDADVSEEWIVSKRLATEARISRGWRGIQMKFSLSGSPPSTQPMHVVEEVDFSSMLRDIATCLSSETPATGFNVSSCARFVLLSSGFDLYVYRLGGTVSSFTLLTTLPCRRRILQVSMDTSSQRYTVAVLLEGRAGMCWDLDIGTEEGLSNASGSMSLGMFASVHSAGASHISAIPSRTSEFRSAPACSIENVQAHAILGDLPSTETQFQPEVVKLPAQDNAIVWSAPSEPALPAEKLAEIRSNIVYEHLGSPDDEPRSVAICPQRKCVAFGCRMGIELHWQDALTGGDLSRWFPLAAPSDHLHFLPQRPGIDSNKKLRLISSAAGPPSSPNASRRGTVPSCWTHNLRSTFERPEPNSRRQTMTRLFFGSLPFPAATHGHIPNPTSTYAAHPVSDDRQGVLRTVDCDHYQAIPLSDGAHVLFTDPASGLLCLGSDAPLGGPTKLLRKFVLTPCKYQPTPARHSPTIYAAGRDLRWGIRIVAAYADRSLVLFNIPVDLFNQVRYSRNRPDVWDEQIGILAQSDLMMDALMDQQPDQDLSHRNTSSTGSIYTSESEQGYDGQRFRSIQINGVKIGDVDDNTTIEDLAIKTENGGLKIWIFQANGRARCFDIYAPRDHETKRRRVAADGSVEDFIEGQLSSTAERSKIEDAGPHVHFGGLDGTTGVSGQPIRDEDHHHHPKRSATIANSPKHFPIDGLDLVKETSDPLTRGHNHQRSASLGASNQQFFSDWPCDEDLMSCLAYKRMIYANIGSQRSSVSGVSTAGSASVRTADSLRLEEKSKKSKKSKSGTDLKGMEIEVLTDWRGESLLEPYLVRFQN